MGRRLWMPVMHAQFPQIGGIAMSAVVKRVASDPKKTYPIPDKLYFKIGEVAEITGVKPYVLRYWESEFKMVSPSKSRSRQRLYRKSDVELINGARKKLKELGYGRISQPELQFEKVDADSALGLVIEELKEIQKLLSD
jgi:hypothetical protein